MTVKGIPFVVIHLPQVDGATLTELGGLVTAAAGLLAAFVALFKYLADRKAENQWRRTQLVSDLADRFESDVNCQEAIRSILQFRHGAEKPNLARILKWDATDLTVDELALRYQFDRYLDFLDRLCSFVFATGTMNVKELLPFSYYMDEVRDLPELREYAESCGFGAVVDMSKKFEEVRRGAGLTELAGENRTPSAMPTP